MSTPVAGLLAWRLPTPRAVLRWVFFLLMVASCLMVGRSVAAAPGEGRAQFETFVSSTSRAQGQFRQEIRERDGRLVETSEGRFAFERPGRVRWEVIKPIAQLLVADGQLLYFHDVDLAQVTERRLEQALASTPAALLFGDASLDRDFEVRDAGQSAGVAWFEARPRSADSGIETLRIGMHEGQPELMEVVDAFGRTSRFTFFALRRNPALDPMLFKFVPPPGTDVIRQ
jgi:outer membrane lipoprotein carrier protein